MRILEVINALEAGGAERMLCCLAKALRKKGHEVSIVCLRDASCMPVPAEELAELDIGLSTLHKADGFSLKAILQVAESARRIRANVIHTHNPLVHHYGILAGRLARVPVVVNTLHGSATLEMSSKALMLYRTSCFLGSCVVPVCDTAEEAFRRVMLSDGRRTKVIANGIDTAGLEVMPQRPLSREVVFGTMARLVPVKNHACLIEGFAKMLRRVGECRLEILGAGELEDNLHELCKTLSVQNRVVFKPWTTDIQGFLKEIDVFVLSSLSEGLPLASLEAMAAGRPVVSTAVGAMPALLNTANSGWLCQPGDPQALADVMVTAALDPGRIEKGRRARQYVLDHYSLQKMADEYENLFISLLPGGHQERRSQTIQTSAVL